VLAAVTWPRVAASGALCAAARRRESSATVAKLRTSAAVRHPRPLPSVPAPRRRCKGRGRPVDEFLRCDGIRFGARRFLGHHLLQCGFDQRVFSSTRGRPPPGRRTLSVGRLARPTVHSCCPRRIVFSSMPVILDSNSIPPRPIRLASRATCQRRCCSSRRLRNRFSCWCRSLAMVGLLLAMGALTNVYLWCWHTIFRSVKGSCHSYHCTPCHLEVVGVF
jgi:hypothetical protein